MNIDENPSICVAHHSTFKNSTFLQPLYRHTRRWSSFTVGTGAGPFSPRSGGGEKTAAKKTLGQGTGCNISATLENALGD